jgi:death-on-curing protein
VLSVENICTIHDAIIKTLKGEPGILDIRLLESAVKNIDQTFDGKDLYPTAIDKAAQLFYSLVKNHAFKDGNKRTAVNILQFYLNFNNYKMNATDDDLIKLATSAAKSEITVADIKMWIIEHTEK